MVVVLAILGLMAAIVVSGGAPVSPASHARAAAQAVAGALRAARGEALATNRSVAFTLDLANRRYRWGAHPVQQLPSDLQLALYADAREASGETLGKIRFDPDGGSSGGRVTVAGGGRVWMVGVDWISGRVSIVQKTQ
jgi:general secretion pathway protein H